MNIIKAEDINFEELPTNLEVVWDTENSSLLNESAIDYTEVPYRLRESFKSHCLVCTDLNSETVWTFVQDEIKTHFPKFSQYVTRWVGQNSINYDHLVIKLYLGLDYTVYPDTFNSKEVIIDDTLVMSKMLNPDRPAHSLEYAGQLLGFPKIDWRAEAVELGLIAKDAPNGAEFEVYHPKMLEYCIRDAIINKKWYFYLKKEWGNWKWEDAYQLEKAVAEIVTRQEHRGFYFDIELAKKNLDELDTMMEEIRATVEPTLPLKPATKTLQKEFTPPVTQFLKNGQPSTHIKKFAARVGAEITGTLEEGFYIVYEDQKHLLPFNDSLVKESVMTLADSTQIKEYLVREYGWKPTSYKERDLTVDVKKKKIPKEKFIIAVERYVEQTLSSAFCQDRCDHLNCTPEELKKKLLDHDTKKPLKVLTNPSFTVGQDKELCPGLERIAESYPHAKAIANWLTYRHRRNSILGGGVNYEDEEEIEKGFLNYVRQDGRIPTPADTCGAGTSRFKHRVVANIPRTTSLYGNNMRAMFGVDVAECYQLGYDFDSLEAKITGHYIWKYKGGPELAHALIAEKPNDIHSSNARKLGISRNDAKTFFYAALYGAQPNKLAKQLGWPLTKAKRVFNGFWEECKPIALLKDNLTKYWEGVGGKKFILGIDGRKIPTRSLHALLNSLFQAGGVICAKRAMVLQDRCAREQDLINDFFKEGKATYFQQLVGYHDECQLEVTKNLVKFKIFNTEEEAKAFNESYWSDVGKAKGGRFYRAYSISGELASKAVTEAGKYYKLNVELTAGYQIGRNWKECH